MDSAIVCCYLWTVDSAVVCVYLWMVDSAIEDNVDLQSYGGLAVVCLWTSHVWLLVDVAVQ